MRPRRQWHRAPVLVAYIAVFVLVFVGYLSRFRRGCQQAVSWVTLTTPSLRTQGFNGDNCKSSFSKSFSVLL